MVVKLLLAAAAILVGVLVLVRMFEARIAFFPTPGADASPAAYGVPFDAVRIDTTDGERLRMWVLPARHPRAMVIYFHGNGGNLSLWLPVLVGLQRQGFSVAAFDYRGYGESTGRPSERGLYRDVDAVLAWITRTNRPDVPLVYWGRSLGTVMAAYAATRQPPDRLILESGFASARTLLRDSRLLAVLLLFSSYRFPTADFARRGSCPVLVLHGDADRVIPIANGRALFDALPEPKRFVVVPGADHNDLVPPQPDTYWSAVRRFIAEGA
jgi:fermentation-respiration switch protein FrsA (DUF1100 family)